MVEEKVRDREEEDYRDTLDEESENQAYGSGGGLSVMPLLAASGAALLGTAVWAGIMLIASYEHGIVAWAVGGVVGIAAVKAGGRGATLGILCAVLSLLSILGGKLVGYHLQISEGIGTSITENCTPELFAELEIDAVDYAALPAEPTDEQLTEFLFSHHYSAASSLVGVTEKELLMFQEYDAPVLVAIQEEGMTIEGWRIRGAEVMRADVAEEGSLLDFVIADLNAIDLLFALLGISTAFGLVHKAR
jgi:hypothetical protein